MNTNDSLVELCRANYADLPHIRVYRVMTPEGKDVFCAAKSPKQAAVSVCSVERVTDKELAAAAFEALGRGE